MAIVGVSANKFPLSNGFWCSIIYNQWGAYNFFPSIWNKPQSIDYSVIENRSFYFFFLFGFQFPKHSNTLYNGCGVSSSHNHSSLQFNAISKARKCQEWRCHPPQTEYSSWLRLFLRLKIIRSLLLQIKFVSTFVWSFFCLKDAFVESLAGVNQSLRVKCSPYIKPKYMTMPI